MKEKIEKVDYDELAKQIKEEALKDGRYGKIEIIMRKGDPAPICSVRIQDMNLLEVALMCITLDKVKESLVEGSTELKEAIEIVERGVEAHRVDFTKEEVEDDGD